jgi:OmcA/MtrC family decaheme c-type cytochrome
VATTTGLTVAAGAKPYATKALIAIGGKPLTQGTFTIEGVSTAKDYFVRVPSPTYAFSMATGASVAARRDAVNTEKCVSCHRGTLYQHGGDRVDNEQLCVICHNPSSSEKNVRVGYGILNADNTVDTSKTYDGKSAETYDLRYLLHSIHGAEKRANPIIIYRSRGIFAFAPEGAAYPTGWPAGGTVDNALVYGSANKYIGHTWTIIDYPKPASECLACHNAGAYEVPDQTKAVALTVEPGTSWSSQTDDISIGPTAGACTACHATSVTRSHASKEGYLANVIKEDMLEMAQPSSWWVLTP